MLPPICNAASYGNFCCYSDCSDGVVAIVLICNNGKKLVARTRGVLVSQHQQQFSGAEAGCATLGIKLFALLKLYIDCY